MEGAAETAFFPESAAVLPVAAVAGELLALVFSTGSDVAGAAPLREDFPSSTVQQLQSYLQMATTWTQSWPASPGRVTTRCSQPEA